MKILYVLKHHPWGIGGGSSACLQYLTAFREVFAGAEMDVVIADHCVPDIPSDWHSGVNFIPVGKRSQLSRLWSCLTGVMHRFQSAAKRQLHRNSYNWCILDHSSIGGSLVRASQTEGCKTVVIHHNYEPKYFEDNTPNPIVRRLLLPHVVRFERMAYRRCDVNVFLSEADLDKFRSHYGNNNGRNIVGGIFEIEPSERIRPTALSASPLRIAITGSLSNVQNADGIHYFFAELYGHIPADVEIVIAGRNPTAEIRALCADKPNVRLIANPPVMADIIRGCSLFLCPARLGSGIKVRISDGFRNGLPVLAHEVSAQGYEDFVTRGYMESFASPQEFVQGLSALTAKIKANLEWSTEIADFYYDKCSLSNIVAQLKAAINECK